MRTFKYLQETHKVLFLMSFILNGCYLQTLNYINMPFKLLSSLLKPSIEPTLPATDITIADAPKQYRLSLPSHSSWREYSKTAQQQTQTSKGVNVQECCKWKMLKESRGRRALTRGKQNRSGIRSRAEWQRLWGKRQIYSGKSEFLSPKYFVHSRWKLKTVVCW